MILFAGEAGIGKTRLLGVLGRQAAGSGFRRFIGGASPYDREIVGGLLLDVARALRGDEVARPAGERLAMLLSDRPGEPADPLRSGRALALAVTDAICGLADHGPTLLIAEDLHWADDLSLEVLARVARRTAGLPLLVYASYRSDELHASARLRQWRSHLLAQRHAEEAQLRRLTESETRTVVTAILGTDAVRAELAALVYERSDGVPLHVEEILGAMRDPGAVGEARDLPVPDTVAEAIVERAARLSPGALAIARTATVIGRAFERGLLCSVVDASPDEVDTALAELREKQFLVIDGEGDWIRFRHALICDVLYEGIRPTQRTSMHGRVAEVSASRSAEADAAYVAAHYERAGDRGQAFRWGLLAARSAAARSAHRAADAAYRLALRAAGSELTALERAGLLAEHAHEAAAIDDNDTAASAYAEARALFAAAGDRRRAAELAAPLAAARHLLGSPLDERRSLLVGALQDLDGEDDQAAAVTRARIEAGLATAYMLDRRLPEAVTAGGEALIHAREVGDLATATNAAVTVGAAKVFAGEMAEGWSILEEAIATAAAHGLEAEAARGHRMIGSCASVLVEYARAERWLREGIAYAERAELWNHRHYMGSHLAHVLWATGRWQEAWSLAQQTLADGRGGITTRVTALHVIGYVALGRGDRTAAEDALVEARALGETMHELQRVAPAMWGLAESALLAGDAARARALAEEGRALSERYRDAAYLFPFVLTGLRAHLAADGPSAAEAWLEAVSTPLRSRSIPGTLPALDHARGVLLVAQGSPAKARQLLEAARTAWLERGRVWEGTWALADLARCELRAGRVDDAGRLAAEARDAALAIGAAPLAEIAAGLARLAAERGALQEPWAPLTAREYQVARAIAQGLTNAQIAAELRISPRTVATHVEHILTKLGASRRVEIATWVSGGVRE